MGASLYEPINVYKPVAPNIGIVDGPFEYLTVGGVKMPLPFTTRMTAVRLLNGDLFLHSPIKFDGRLANELLGLWSVRHLVSPNQFHYAHIGEWAKAFPNAVSWASPRVRERARARQVDIDFTRDLDANPPEEWSREIDQTLFPGGYFKEFIFFHKTSKTLILTDTIINIELDKMSEPWRTATKLTGMYHPFGQIFFGMRLPLLLQRQKAEAAIRKIHSWQPQRILLSPVGTTGSVCAQSRLREHVRFVPIADITGTAASASSTGRLSEYPTDYFVGICIEASAIRGKADMPFCTAYVR